MEYRQKLDKTYLEGDQIRIEYWQRACNKLHQCLATMMGRENYDAWCNENLSDLPVDWETLYGLLDKKYDGITQQIEQERLDWHEQHYAERPV